MSGGAWEYVAGYRLSSNDKSGFTSTELITYSKYLDIYPSNSDMTTYNNRILGDATGEMGPFYYYADKDGSNRRHNNWYRDYSDFINSTSPWILRGCYFYDGVIAGQFNFNRDSGDSRINNSFRLVLTVKI